MILLRRKDSKHAPLALNSLSHPLVVVAAAAAAAANTARRESNRFRHGRVQLLQEVGPDAQPPPVRHQDGDRQVRRQNSTTLAYTPFATFCWIYKATDAHAQGGRSRQQERNERRRSPRLVDAALVFLQTLETCSQKVAVLFVHPSSFPAFLRSGTPPVLPYRSVRLTALFPRSRLFCIVLLCVGFSVLRWQFHGGFDPRRPGARRSQGLAGRGGSARRG